jgi:hypothetical protein
LVAVQKFAVFDTPEVATLNDVELVPSGQALSSTPEPLLATVAARKASVVLGDPLATVFLQSVRADFPAAAVTKPVGHA